MPDPKHDDMHDRLDHWGDAHAHDESDGVPGAFLDAVAAARHARRRRHAAIASAVLAVGTVAGWVALRPPSPAPTPAPRLVDNPTPTQDPPTAQAPTIDAQSATIFAMMRANDGYTRDDVVLPEPIALSWALESPLGS